MSLTDRDQHLEELMDDPGCDPERLRRTLQRFAVVNRLVAGWDGVYRSHLRPALARTNGPARILDIGCGGGDVLRRLVLRARGDGFAVTGIGVDPDGRALEVARSAPQTEGVTYRQAFGRDLVAEGATFDIVLSNHLLHHLRDAEFTGLLADSEALATTLAIHSDIARGRLAYAAYAAGITPFAPGTFLRTDGLRSIRRSYTRDELAARLPRGWAARQVSTFRLLAVHHTQSGRR
ncbi:MULTISPECIES: methyltransferase domain-containing protein [unclassified Leucobacter]|uniref:methyltransferase domain-containing protein n=1 Tax=unclassified Leucobacter TaxID=2621730 RepID=UPI00165D543B|nr:MULTISPECIES: methyltransferase domain-containing protein [unclassified Leucobacter]MBC9936452.1 methyltransferase domain-containing protein [Leucobacter sp. cx-87]